MPYLDNVYLANLNFVCRAGDYFRAPPDSSWKKSTDAFRQNKFYYLTEGSCIVTARDTTYTLQAGDWLFIPAGLPHSYSSHPELPLEKYWMHFDIYPDSFLTLLPELPLVVATGESREQVTNLFARFLRCFKSENLSNRLEAKAIGIWLLVLYLRLAYPDGVHISQKSDEAPQDLLQYIQQHLSEPLSNADMAEQVYLHPTYFCRWFRDRVGMAPQQYLLRCRLEAAKQLLEETDYAVNEIALRVGFQDPAHLSHAFRRQYALSPTQYRSFAGRSKAL